MDVCICSKEFPKLRNRKNLICVDFIMNSVNIADYLRYFVFQALAEANNKNPLHSSGCKVERFCHFIP